MSFTILKFVPLDYLFFSSKYSKFIKGGGGNKYTPVIWFSIAYRECFGKYPIRARIQNFFFREVGPNDNLVCQGSLLFW